MDMTDDPTVVVERDGTVRYLNDAASALLGASSTSAVVDTSVLEYVAPEFHTPLLDQFERIGNGESSATGLQISLTPPASRPRTVVAVHMPVEREGSERIQMSLFATEEDLPSGLRTLTLNESPIGISIADATREDLPLIYVNDGFCDLTGYDREEVIGRNCRFLQGDGTDPGTVTELREALAAERPVAVEIRNYRKDGSMFWNRLSITPVEDDAGTVTHFFGFQEDITDQKLYEHEKTLFEMQADSIAQAVFITDAEGAIQYANPAFERVTGYTVEEAIGENPRLLKSDQQDEAFSRDLWGTISAGEVWEAELTNRRKSGELYQVNQKIVPVTDTTGTITHFVAIEEDITDSQFIEQVLHVMDRVLRHNVRTSANAIDGYAELLEGELAEPEHRAALRTIRRHAEKLGRLSHETRSIRELFDRRHTQPNLSVGRIAEFVEDRRRQHPHATIDCSIEVPEEVTVQNGSLLQLVIDEALENAVVHADRDSPHVDVRVRLEADGTELRIDIADDGPGIPDDEWNVIVEGRETPLAHSSGIGLWLIYWTLTALGGTMERTANDPRGTVLTFRISLGAGRQTDDWNPA